ncbi:unnamed protein product [Dicrocoelium dendriticum]|nr:unnamed protein product [Dicrocoelium dendriticum]
MASFGGQFPDGRNQPRNMPGSFPQQLIPVESLSEYDVQEILPDGREILEKPLTPAEHFQQVLNHIDFTKSYDDSAGSDETEIQSRASERAVSKMWNSLREAVRMALTEIRAFVDILAVIKEEKYLSLFPISNDPPELNLPLLFSGKKRALASAAEVLLKGTERLRRRHSELADARLRASTSSSDRKKNTFPSDNFHTTLMQLRQEWRLKLHQNSVIGDVSLRSIGSRFRESGTFEIRESDLIADKIAGNSLTQPEPDGGVEVVFARSVEALLNSTVEPNLLVCFLETGIDSGPISLWDHVLKLELQDCNTSSETIANRNCTGRLSQRERLVKTQRLLACREILFTLASESSGLNPQSGLSSSDCVSFATQDQLITNIFPGVQVVIGFDTRPSVPDDLDHQVENVKPEISPVKAAHLSPSPKPIRTIRSLGLQLHRLLAAQHRVAWSNLASLPQSACGPVQVPAHHRAAGAHALPATYFSRSVDADSSGFSIAVAGVAGFAGPAAAAWSSLNLAPRSRGSESTAHVSQRLAPVSITQDRLALFTEWGSMPCGSQTQSLPTISLLSAPNPFDDSVQAAATVASVEHMLSRKKADDGAIQSVVGSTASLFDKTIAICKHYFLREKVSKLLSDFLQTTPVRMTVHWDAINSAVLSSARISFHAVNYDAYRLWLGLSVSHTGITVFYPDPPRSLYLGTDMLRLRHLLTKQVIHTQMHALDLLITKILGWSQLGSNSSSGICGLDEADEGPTLVKMFASPSGQNFVCIRAGSSSGLRLFVSTPTARGPSDNHRPVTDIGQFHSINNLFREVRLCDVRSGPHDVARIEAVMTALS